MNFSGISTHVNDYSRQLPRNMRDGALMSAGISFVISALLTNNVNHSLRSGAIAATVSLVSSLTMPFFRQAFADNRGSISWGYHAFSLLVSLAVTQVLVNSLTNFRVNLIAGVMFTIGLNLLVNGFRDQSTYSATSYILV